jgi:hypothetical protein
MGPMLAVSWVQMLSLPMVVGNHDSTGQAALFFSALSREQGQWHYLQEVGTHAHYLTYARGVGIGTAGAQSPLDTRNPPEGICYRWWKWGNCQYGPSCNWQATHIPHWKPKHLGGMGFGGQQKAQPQAPQQHPPHGPRPLLGTH